MIAHSSKLLPPEEETFLQKLSRGRRGRGLNDQAKIQKSGQGSARGMRLLEVNRFCGLQHPSVKHVRYILNQFGIATEIIYLLF